MMTTEVTSQDGEKDATNLSSIQTRREHTILLLEHGNIEEELVNKLMNAQVISEEDTNRIKEKETNDERRRKLTAICLQLNDNRFETFYTILKNYIEKTSKKETDDSGTSAETLLKQRKRPELLADSTPFPRAPVQSTGPMKPGSSTSLIFVGLGIVIIGIVYINWDKNTPSQQPQGEKAVSLKDVKRYQDELISTTNVLRQKEKQLKLQNAKIQDLNARVLDLKDENNKSKTVYRHDMANKQKSIETLFVKFVNMQKKVEDMEANMTTVIEEYEEELEVKQKTIDRAVEIIRAFQAEKLEIQKEKQATKLEYLQELSRKERLLLAEKKETEARTTRINYLETEMVKLTAGEASSCQVIVRKEPSLQSRTKQRCIGSVTCSDTPAFRTECPTGFKLTLGKCYYIGPNRLTYQEAVQKCEQMNAHLPVITKVEENDALLMLVRNSVLDIRWYWLGAISIDMQKHWFWYPTGDPFSYENWCYGEPNDEGNQYCLVGQNVPNRNRKGCWDDGHCWAPSHFICEWNY